MNAISKRKWYLLCIVSGLVAVGAELYSDHHAGLSMQAMAKKTADKFSDSYHTVVEYHLNLSGIGGTIGFLFVGLFILLWVVSFLKGEPGLQSVPIVLLVLYISQFALMV